MAKDLTGITAPVLADDCQMTLDFGNTYSDGSFHKGIDLITGKASAVIAPCDAKVEKADDGFKVGDKSANYGMGNCIYLLTDAGIRIRFHHLACNSIKVKKGASVKKGDNLATIGNTGNSTGRHLHCDISVSGKDSSGRYVSDQARTYYDPKPYLKGVKSLTKTSAITEPVKFEPKKSKRMKVNTSALNVRADASLYAKVVKIIYKNETVNVVEEKGEWAKIADGQYVCSKYLKEA